ncbi:MAG: hypothetical protein ACE5E7_06765 [Anaerolineae bacterium]
MTFSITRAGHIEFRVTDLEQARHFYVDALGFLENGRDATHLYLGGLEEREHHGLSLRLADSFPRCRPPTTGSPQPSVFYCSELTVTEDEPPSLWAAWLHRKQNVHDIAVMNGTGELLPTTPPPLRDRPEFVT